MIAGLCLGFFYTPMFAGSFAFTTRTPTIDTQHFPDTIYADPLYLLTYQSGQLAKGDGPVVLFVGASDVREGFRPEVINGIATDYRAHNLGIGADNITQNAQVISMAAAQVGETRFRRSVVVLGLSYLLFVEDHVRWGSGNTVFADTALASRLYAPDAFTPRFSPPAMDSMVTALRPYLLWMKGRSELSRLRQSIQNRAPAALAPEADPAYQREALRYFSAYMARPDGRLADEQFAKLEALVDSIRARGARVMLVDLPLPMWHRRGQPLFQDYEQRKQPVLARLAARDGVQVVDLRTAYISDSDFRDSAHPKPETAVRWSQVIGHAIPPAASHLPQ